jgi:hypothetical protein
MCKSISLVSFSFVTCRCAISKQSLLTLKRKSVCLCARVMCVHAVCVHKARENEGEWVGVGGDRPGIVGKKFEVLLCFSLYRLHNYLMYVCI